MDANLDKELWKTDVNPSACEHTSGLHEYCWVHVKKEQQTKISLC